MRNKVNTNQAMILILLLILCTTSLLQSQCTGDNTFTGDTDNCWSTPSNWSAGCVPCGDTIRGVIIIEADCIVKVSNSTNCLFGNSATLAIKEGVTLTNNSTGDWSVFNVVGSGTYEGDLPIYGGVKPGNDPPSTPVFTCDNSFEYEGQSYATVQIGGQCWMAENLNVGTMIFDDTYIAADNGIIEKHCYDDNIFNCTTYGGLYQWEEMMQYNSTESSQGICPTDWHLPSDYEFKTLEIQLGMTLAQANASYEHRGTDQGSQMGGEELLWINGNLDQNIAFGTSGFTAIPGGMRGADAGFFDSNRALFWTSSQDGYLKWVRSLNYANPKVYRFPDPPESGFSVRCVHD